MLVPHLVRYFDPPAGYPASSLGWARPAQGVEPDEGWLREMIQDEPLEQPGSVAGLYACGGYWVFVRMNDVGEGWLEPARVDVRTGPAPFSKKPDRPPINSTMPMRQLPLTEIFADLRSHYVEILESRVEAGPTDQEWDAAKLGSAEYRDALPRLLASEDASRLLGAPSRPRVGRPPLSDTFLREVAAAYLKAKKAGKPARAAVRDYATREIEHYSEKSAAPLSSVDRWIKAATERGFLEPTTTGRARSKPKGR